MGIATFAAGLSRGSVARKIDHVVASSTGGRHTAGNYLAAHKDCNKSRWHSGPEEWRYILKLGHLRAEPRRASEESPLGRDVADVFRQRERSRIEWRVKSTHPRYASRVVANHSANQLLGGDPFPLTVARGRTRSSPADAEAER